MEAKAIDREILQYLPLLGDQEKKSLLGVIRSFLSLKTKTDPEDSVFLDEYNKELDEAMARIDNGSFFTQDEVERLAAEW
jgi:hypothetical protein